MRGSKWAAVLAITGLVLGASCGDDDDDGGAAPTGVETPETTAGGEASTPEVTDAATSPSTTGEPESSDDEGPTTLRARFALDPTSMDSIAVANASDITVVSMVIETLILAAPDGEDVPLLADTWEVSADGRTIDFTLKQGIQFHGGYGELTMDDVKFSLDRAAGLIEGVESGIAQFYTALEEVEIVDDYTGRILLEEPSVTLLRQALPLTGVISKAAYDEVGADAFAQHPIGTGPYQFGEVAPGEHVRLTGFPEYGGQDPFVPSERYDEVVFQIIPEDSAAELAYEAGDIDMLAPMRPAAVERFEGLEDTTIAEGAGMQYRFIGMNMLDPALSNEDLRKAIVAAIDVESIVLATSEGRDVRATALVGPSSPIGYWADAPVHEQDLDEARRLVELVPEADRSLRFTIQDDEISRTVAQVAQANLQDAGLDVEIEILDPATFFVADETNRRRQLFYTEYGINYREPSQELVWFTCDQFDVWNYVYFCDEEYDRLFAEAGVELDEAARNDAYVEMQRIWEEAANTVWVSHPTIFVAMRDDVSVEIDPAGTVYWQTLAPA
jgi:peptide/nickel transport system substrate-binding protein